MADLPRINVYEEQHEDEADDHLAHTFHHRPPSIIKVKGSQNGGQKYENEQRTNNRRMLQLEVVFLIEHFQLVVFEPPTVEDP